MSEEKLAEDRDEADGPGHPAQKHFLRRHLPYLLILAMALVGVAYTNMAQTPLVGYWEVLALLTGTVCVFTEWSKQKERQERLRLVWTQALHWVAVLVAMNIMLLAGVRQLLPAPATSLVLLILLALGSFLAGVSLASLELGFLGVVLALAVPTIAWIKQTVLFILIIVALVVGVVMAFWLSRNTD
jgi:hypothetical protein